MFTVRPTRAMLAISTVLLSAACSAGAVAPTSPGVATIPTLPPLVLPGLATGGAPQPAPMGHVGDTLKFASFDRAEIDVTLAKVFDPATPTDAYTSAPSGAHWVGVEMVIVNNDDISGEQSIADATSSDGSVLTTDQDYHGTAYPIGNFQGCTNNPEEIDEVQGQPYTNCKAFVVPNGQTLKQVGIRVGGAELFLGQVSADQATWLVP